METKVKTRSVTNTQIAVAVGVAVLASGLAFAASPNRRHAAPACTTQSVEFVDSCPKGGKYRSANYVCSDGSHGRAPGSGCRTASKLQQVVDRACSRKQCTGSPAVAPTPAPVAPAAPDEVIAPEEVVVAPVVESVAQVEGVASSDAPAPVQQLQQLQQISAANSAVEESQCGLQDIRYTHSCGRNKYETVEFTCTDGYASSHNTSCSSLSALQEAAVTACAYRDCRVRQIRRDAPVSETDTSNPNYNPTQNPTQNSIQKSIQKIEAVNNGAPIVFISGSGPTFRADGAGKVIVSVPLANRGAGVAGSNVKYTLYFLDGQKNIIQTVDLNLSSELGVGDEKVFETTLPIPDGALFAEAVVDKSFSDGLDNDFTVMIPTDLFIQ